MTLPDHTEPDAPNALERASGEAFTALERGAPNMDRHAVWARISPEIARGRGHSTGWRTTLSSLLTTRALAAAGMAAVAVVAATALTLSNGGGRADAALLEAARSLSSATDAALADGTLSSDELDALRNDAEALLADIVADPAGLDSLSADDLEALAAVLNSLEDRLRHAEANATPALEKVESAAGLAISALRSSRPDHTLVSSSSSSRDESFSVATIGNQTVAVGVAGSATIEVASGSLTLIGTAANPGWTVEVESDAGRELEADFRNGAQRIKFNAELEDGVLRIRIENEGSSAASVSATATAAATAPATAPSTPSGSDDGRNREETRFSQAAGTTATYDVPGAGTVTVARTDNGLTIASTSTAAGWVIEVETASGLEVEADFRNGAQRIKFNAELEDGQVRIRIENVSVSPSSTPSSGSSSLDDDRNDGRSDDRDEDDRDDDDRSGSNNGSGSGS